MRKNKFTNVLTIQDKNTQKNIINESPYKILGSQNLRHNKIYFPINLQDKLSPYKQFQKIDLSKKEKKQFRRNDNDQNKFKLKQKIGQQNQRKIFNRQKKFTDLFLEDKSKIKNRQISRNTISFKKPSKIILISSRNNHVYRSKNIRSLKNIETRINTTLNLKQQPSKEIFTQSDQNLKKIKSQINSSVISPKINKDYSAYLPSKKYSRSKLYSTTRNSPQRANIGSDQDWICQKIIREQVYGFQNQQVQL